MLFALVGTSSCGSDPNREVLPPVVVAMLETTAPAYDDGQQKIFQVSREVRLPFRRAEDNERPSGDQDPYPRKPFHLAGDSHVTVRFTLTNLEDKPHNVDLLVDPWNEFVRYVPGFAQIRENQVVPNFSGIQRPFVLGPKERIEGIITPDDMVELATDLTTAMSLQKRPPDPAGAFGGAALYNRAFNIQNRSSEPDPVLDPWLPRSRADLATIIGFDLGLRTAEAAKIAVEVVIDIEDLKGNRIVIQGDPEGTKEVGRPGGTLTPPAAAAAK
jgi:hypothetical protein